MENIQNHAFGFPWSSWLAAWFADAYVRTRVAKNGGHSLMVESVKREGRIKAGFKIYWDLKRKTKSKETKCG